MEATNQETTSNPSKQPVISGITPMYKMNNTKLKTCLDGKLIAG